MENSPLSSQGKQFCITAALFFPPSACKPAEFLYKSEQEAVWLSAESMDSRGKLFKSEVLETNSIITVQLSCRKRCFLFCAPGPAAAEPTRGSGQSVHADMNTCKAAKWGRYTLNTATLERILFLYFVYKGQKGLNSTIINSSLYTGWQCTS